MKYEARKNAFSSGTVNWIYCT